MTEGSLKNKLQKVVTISVVVLLLFTVANVMFVDLSKGEGAEDDDGLPRSVEKDQTLNTTTEFELSKVSGLPDRIENFTACWEGGNIELDWDNAPFADEYILKRKDSENGEYNQIYSNPTSDYTDQKVNSGNKYWYKIAGSNSVGTGEWNETSIGSQSAGNATNLSVENVGYGEVTLSWNKSKNTQKYKVFRAYFKNVTDDDVVGVTSSTSYTDEDVDYDETYYYTVAPSNDNGMNWDNRTNRVNVTTPGKPDIPSFMEFVTSISDNQNKIWLSWKYDEAPSSSGNVHIYRKHLSITSSMDSYNTFEKIKTYTDPTAKGAQSYTDYDVGESGEYSYYVEYEAFVNGDDVIERSDVSSEYIDDSGTENSKTLTSGPGNPGKTEPAYKIFWGTETLPPDFTTYHNAVLKKVEVDNILLKLPDDVGDSASVNLMLKAQGKTEEKQIEVDNKFAKYNISMRCYEDYLSDSSEFKKGWELKIESVDEVNITQLKLNPQINYTWCLNPRDEDTDDDGLDDRVEVEELSSSPFKEDTDYDDCRDELEVEVGTNPSRYDTDEDGLKDGIEVKDPSHRVVMPDGDYRKNDDGTYWWGGLDPLDPDTDNDTLPDGDEYFEREFTYFKNDTAELNDTAEKSKTELEESDPLVAYMDVNGARIDIDKDNIPAWVEQNPDMIESSTFNDVPWIASIRRFKQEFRKRDKQKMKIYNSTFNSFVKEEGNPIVTKLKIKIVSTQTAKVTIGVYDPSGIDSIKLENEYTTKKWEDITPADLNDKGVIEKTCEMDIDTEDWSDGWGLHVSCQDEAGNWLNRTKHSDGQIPQDIIGDIIDLGDWIWDHTIGALIDGAEKAVELASSFIDWAKDKIAQIFHSTVSSAVSGLQNWADTIQEKMSNFFAALAEWEDGDGHVKPTMLAGTELMLSFIGQQDRAEEITNTLSWVMNFIKPFQKYLSPFGAVGVISSVFNANNKDGSGLFNSLTNLEDPHIEVIWEIITESSLLGDVLSSEIDLGTTIPSIGAMKNFLNEADLPELPIVSQVIELLPGKGESSQTISVKAALLLGLGMGSYGAYPSPTMAGVSILTNVMSWMLNLLSWIVDGMRGQLYGWFAASVGSISFLSGYLAGILGGYQIVSFVGSPLIGLYLSLSQMGG